MKYLTALSLSTKSLSLTAHSLSPLSAISLTVTALSHSHRHQSLLSLSLYSLSLSHRISLTVNSLSLTEISLTNPKSLSSLRLRLRRGRRVCRRRSPEIGASEALSRRRCPPHPNPSSHPKSLPLYLAISELAELKLKAEENSVDVQRRQKVKEAMLHAWTSYEKYAWGQDELRVGNLNYQKH
ncbi:hypothetical protein Syun_003624 [Stephania yunnanensis]|uniref:Uncharacterized protein n=1 Tax=Stephania yunnanensis TaxID=152371 RepID=A0AAP0L342_9MAGN